MRVRQHAVAWSTAVLAACGGGGGGDTLLAQGPGTPAVGMETAAPVTAPVQTAPESPAPPPAAPPAAPSQTTPPVVPDIASCPAGMACVQGSSGPDTLEGSGSQPVVMMGGAGDDIYIVRHPDDRIVEHEGGGIDEVRTELSYTLPANVEKLSVLGPGAGTLVLRGNALDNHIVGAPFSYEEIHGEEGNDILDGGGRHGGLLDGGPGDDRLIVSFGELRGGPGADVFVAGGRGANTSPDALITVLDFTPAEGDRIEILHTQTLDAATLFSTGHLRFEPEGRRLVFTLDPAAYASTPTAVEQVFYLPGVERFEPSWVSVVQR